MSNFLRQKYKEKSQAWGPVEAVQRSIKINADMAGIPAPFLLLPFWESAGEARNIMTGEADILSSVSSYPHINKWVIYQNIHATNF